MGFRSTHGFGQRNGNAIRPHAQYRRHYRYERGRHGQIHFGKARRNVREHIVLLNGRVALITGGSRGIGLAIADQFARHGATVILADRNTKNLESARLQLQDKFPAAHIADFNCDVSIEEHVQSMIQEVFETNAYGVIYCAQYASRLMSRSKSGSIINLASIMGVNGNAGQTIYAGSKAAVIGITKSLAKELAPNNIRVNAIAPGFINTSMATSLPPEKFQERLASIKMGRIGEPDEVAKVALFLASDLSSYVTGQGFEVDGGMGI